MMDLLLIINFPNKFSWLNKEQFHRWLRNWYWHSSSAIRNERLIIKNIFGFVWQYWRCSIVKNVNDEQNCFCSNNWDDDDDDDDDDHNWNEGKPRDL